MLYIGVKLPTNSLLVSFFSLILFSHKSKFEGRSKYNHTSEPWQDSSKLKHGFRR